MEEVEPCVRTHGSYLCPASFRRRCTVVLKVRNAAARLIRWHLKLPSCWCSKAKLRLKVQQEEVNWFHSTPPHSSPCILAPFSQNCTSSQHMQSERRSSDPHLQHFFLISPHLVISATGEVQIWLWPSVLLSPDLDRKKGGGVCMCG